MVLTLWLGFLLVVSLIPVPGPRVDLPADKAEHFIAYGITAILVMRHLIAKGGREKVVVLSIGAASLYGALIEIFQAFTPYRQFSFGDMAANTAGAVVFSLAYAAATK